MKQKLVLKVTLSCIIFGVIELKLKQDSITTHVWLPRSQGNVSPSLVGINGLPVEGFNTQSIHFWVYPGKPHDWEEVLQQTKKENQTNDNFLVVNLSTLPMSPHLLV